MSLDLDTRQRAMLQEMGITVWQPETVVETADEIQYVAKTSQNPPQNPLQNLPQNAINNIANKPINTPATAISASSRAISEKPSVNLPVKQTTQQPAPPAVALQPMPAGLQEMDWFALQQTAQACQACQLCKGRQGIVFGKPALVLPADWLIVGDPPSESDEAAGTPFTGDEGVLLGNMLIAMGLSVAQVTLTPSVKCRSEGQSTGAQELAQCEAYLRRQVALTRPKMILAMGRYAAQALLAKTVSNPVPPLGQLRGVVHQYEGIPVVVTYSPANLLRSPAEKAKAWADLCLAKSVL